MDVAVSRLRASLAEYVHRARQGDEVVVTDRGVPVARLVGVDTAPVIEQMYVEGVLVRPAGPRPRATRTERVPTTGDVSGVVSAQRD